MDANEAELRTGAQTRGYCAENVTGLKCRTEAADAIVTGKQIGRAHV